MEWGNEGGGRGGKSCRYREIPHGNDIVFFYNSNSFSFSALLNVFRKLDVNKEGKISPKNLRVACRKLGVMLTKDELQEILDEAASNCNGKEG